MTAAVDLSVVTVTYNHSGTVIGAIESVERHRGDLRTEALVVDVGSTDGTVDAVGSCRSARILTMNNRGFAAAANVGLASTSGRWCLLLNPDAEIISGSIAGVIERLDQNPRVALAGIPQVDGGNVCQPVVHRFPSAARQWCEAVGLDRVLRGRLGHQDLRDRTEPQDRLADWLAGSVLFVRRSVYECVGGLDESFFLYCEEVEWARRFQAHGYFVQQVTGAVARHRSPRRSDPRRAAQLASAKTQYARRFLPHPRRDAYLMGLRMAHVLRALLPGRAHRELRCLSASLGLGAPPFAEPRAVVLLDNENGPDRRVATLGSAFAEVPIPWGVIAWNRRSVVEPGPRNTVRVDVAAPSGGGPKTLLAAARFSAHLLIGRPASVRQATVVVASDIYLLPVAVLLATVRRKTLVYDAREDWSKLEAPRYPHWLCRGVARVETWLARRAAFVVVPGRERVPRWAAERIETVVLPNVGTTRQPQSRVSKWDVACCGLMAPQRRFDLILELAQIRPELRFVITGDGRCADAIRSEAMKLPNVTWLGWVREVDEILAASSVIYYPQSPDVPYSDVACPNTLYQAVLVRRPLVFHCGGQLARATQRYRLGIRCRPEVGALSSAVDAALASEDWDFEQAREALIDGATSSFSNALAGLASV